MCHGVISHWLTGHACMGKLLRLYRTFVELGEGTNKAIRIIHSSVGELVTIPGSFDVPCG